MSCCPCDGRGPVPPRSYTTKKHYDSQSGITYEVSSLIIINLLPPNNGEVDVDEKILRIMDSQKRNVHSISVHNAKSISDGFQTSDYVIKRCLIQDAFSVPSSTVQTAAAKLYDAGCRQLMLAPSENLDYELDEDDAREVIEAVLSNDIEGAPISERIGLRISAFDDFSIESNLDEAIEL